jgi:hypothetical protein
MVVIQKNTKSPRLTLTLNIALNTPLNNKKNLRNDMDLPSRVSKPLRKMKLKPSSHFSIFFSYHTNKITTALCSVLGEEEGRTISTLYI